MRSRTCTPCYLSFLAVNALTRYPEQQRSAKHTRNHSNMSKKIAGNYLRRHRRTRGLSQRELALLVGYKQQWQVSRHELSKTMPPLRYGLNGLGSRCSKARRCSTGALVAIRRAKVLLMPHRKSFGFSSICIRHRSWSPENHARHRQVHGMGRNESSRSSDKKRRAKGSSFVFEQKRGPTVLQRARP